MLAATVLVAACSTTPHRAPHGETPPPERPQPKPAEPPKPPAPRNAIEAGISAGPPVSALDLSADQAGAARDAFLASCRSLLKRKDLTGLTQPTDWAPACTAAAVPGSDPVAFFQSQFETLLVGNGALFATGYYAPEIEGSRTHDAGYDVPVYRRPPDLVEMDSGVAAGGPPTGKKVRGRMQDGQFAPYYDRAAIDAGALANQGLEIAWVQDPVALFEVQVQGSGRIQLAEGGVMNLGFDGSNNRTYTAIGNVLLEQGAFKSKEQATWPAIRDWLKRNPQQARDVMRKNERYIFFKDTRTGGAIGAEGVPLTAQRSMAADTAFTPYGTPVWIDTTRPVTRRAGANEGYRRLLIAQDAGAAIQGPARGDVFFGGGAQAADWAGRMNSAGRAIVLVPNKG